MARVAECHMDDYVVRVLEKHTRCAVVHAQDPKIKKWRELWCDHTLLDGTFSSSSFCPSVSFCGQHTCSLATFFKKAEKRK